MQIGISFFISIGSILYSRWLKHSIGEFIGASISLVGPLLHATIRELKVAE